MYMYSKIYFGETVTAACYKKIMYEIDKKLDKACSVLAQSAKV